MAMESTVLQAANGRGRDFMTERVYESTSVPFHCRRCGNCCRNIKGQLLVEPMDAFYMARSLKCGDMGEFYDNYTEPTLLGELYPVFLMKTTGADDACIFLKDSQCSIYESRPRTCRLYPFSVKPNISERTFSYIQTWDQHAIHYVGLPVSVNTWMDENFDEEAKLFKLAEYQAIPELASLLQRLPLDKKTRFYSQVIFLHYFNYVFDQSFLLQHSANLAELKRRLLRAL